MNYSTVDIINSIIKKQPKPTINRILKDNLVDINTLRKYPKVFDKFSANPYWRGIYGRFGSYEDQSPMGYFRIYVNDLKISKEEYKKFCNILNTKYETIDCREVRNGFLVRNHELERLLSEFAYSGYFIDMSNLSRESVFYNRSKLLSMYGDRWHWEFIYDNISISWTFELVRENISKIDWTRIINVDGLSWGIKEIQEFEGNLHFTNLNVRRPDGTWVARNYLINNSQKVNASISLSRRVIWTEELIDLFAEKWDWVELSANPSIQWTEKLIDKFQERIDFKVLSLNNGVKWSEALLDRYNERLDWHFLSGNVSLPWNLEFIEKYGDKWTWIPPEKVRYGFKIPSHLYPFKSKPFPNEEAHYSISTNKAIKWDIDLIRAVKNKVDFWWIAAFGNIDIKIFQVFKSDFDKVYIVGKRWEKDSDFAPDEYQIFRNGWQNLNENPNAFINEDVFSFFDRTKTMYRNDEKIQNRIITEDLEVPITDIVFGSSVILDETILPQLINSSFGNYLNNDRYINDSIWKDFIRPYLIKSDNMICYIENLSTQIIN